MLAPALSSRAETIFLRAIELQESDRSRYLGIACGEDADLLRQIESLLRGGGDALATTLLRQQAGLAMLTTPSERLPIRLERYDLESRIGQGSFGVVYRAVQHTPVRRAVAVKVLRPGLDSSQVVRRFEAERQALATMEHPNIAHLFDAGNMPDGRPYFVMELLEGAALTAFCDRHKLNIRQRMTLFLQVCAAVEHAHRRGVMHRDLKPANIIVVQRDTGASAKVIDFGIARALGAATPFGTLATEAGRLMGTPEYMSPEQIDGDPCDVDTRSDVYALGVVLYEVLCGRLPFDSQRLRSARLSELRRIVCEQEPPPPSRAWHDDREGLVDVASKRAASADEFLLTIRNEIEWVAVRAMRKAPAERYQHVTSLADDIRNYLDGRPLLAGPDSVGYRARKFMRRHRGPVAALTAIFALLMTAVIGTTIGMINANRQRTRAELQLADTLLVRGQYATGQSQFVDAWDAFVRAREIHSRLGKPTLPEDIGLYGVLVKADPPVATLETTQQGNPWLAFADDGQTLITSSERASSSIEWDLQSRRRRREYPFQVVAISSDRRVLFGIDAAKRIAAWDRATLAKTVEFEADISAPVLRFACSPDGRWLAACHEFAAFVVWDASTGKRAGQFNVPPGYSGRMMFSPDSRRAVLAQTPIRVWDTATWTEIKQLPSSRIPGTVCLDVSSDGKLLATGGWNSTPAVMDIESGEVTHEFSAHAAQVDAVCFSPDSKWLVSGGADAAVRLWSLSDGASHRAMFGHRKPVRAIEFAPDNRHFASASVDGEIRLWDLHRLNPEFEIRPGVTSDVWEFPFSQDDSLFGPIGDANGKDFNIWDTNSRTVLSRLQVSREQLYPGFGFRFTADGQHVLGVMGTSLGNDSVSTVSHWDVRSGACSTLLGAGQNWRGVLSTRDGKRLITYGDWVGVQAWELPGANLLWERKNDKRSWRYCNMSQDGRYISIGNPDGTGDVVRGQDGSVIRHLETIRHPIMFFPAAHPDCLLWSHEVDDRPHLLNIVTGREIWVGAKESLQKAEWFPTPDGTMVVIVNGERRLDFLDMADGRLLFSAVLPEPIIRCALAPGLTRLAYLSNDNHLWIADLTLGPQMVESDQLRPTDGRGETSRGPGP